MSKDNDNYIQTRAVKGTEEKIARVIGVIINIIFLFTLGIFIYGFVASPSLELFKSHAVAYDGEWIYQDADGNSESFVMPYVLDTEVGEIVRATTVLPSNIHDGMYICFTSGRSINVYIEDEKIFSYDSEDNTMPGVVVKALCIPVELKADYAGKKLTLERGDRGCFNGNMNQCYLGDLLGIVGKICEGRIPQYLGATLLAIASFITLIVFLLKSIINKKVLPLVYLAHGMLIISLWIMLDSYIFQFMFGRYFVDGFVAYMLAILMAIPFVYYFNIIQEYRHRTAYMIIEICIIVNYVVLTILHMAKVRSYEEVLVHINAFTICYIVGFLAICIKDYFVDGNKKHVRVLVGFLGMCFMALIEVFIVIVKAVTHGTSELDGLFILVGLYILLLAAILDQVKSLNELHDATQNAIAATKAKSEFLANMSHEIRTPINAIMGMNEMILRECEQEKIKEYAQDVGRASKNLLDIVNDILDFSKIESGMLEIVSEEYNLGEVISDVTNLVTIKAREKGLKLKILVNPEMPYKLRGDEKRLREIILNLLNNAVKYTEKGHIELKVDGDVNEDSLMLQIAVSDTGQGIRQEDIEKIFGGFERVNIKRNKNIEGTGLGLTITQNIVQLMDGDISVESEYGKGSIFRVVLPQAIIDSERMGDYKAHNHVSQKKELVYEQLEAEDATVLIVDDQPINLKVLSMLVKKTKMQVTEASSGAEALEQMKKQHFDLILLDHMMPEMDGIETVKAAKCLEGNLCEDTPMIALTANAIVGAKEFYLDAGFDGYMSKPVLPEVLMETLINFLPEDKVIIKNNP